MEWSVRSCLKEVSTSKTETFLNDHPLSNSAQSVWKQLFQHYLSKESQGYLEHTYLILNLVRNGGESKQKEMIT